MITSSAFWISVSSSDLPISSYHSLPISSYLGHSREEPDFCSWGRFWGRLLFFPAQIWILVNCKASCCHTLLLFFAIYHVLPVMCHAFTLLNCLFLLLLFDNSWVNDAKFPKDYNYFFLLLWFYQSALQHKVVLKLDWIYWTLTNGFVFSLINFTCNIFAWLPLTGIDVQLFER